MDHDQGTSDVASPLRDHPGIKRKGDRWIVEQLEHALWRNRNGDNPNLRRSRIIFDFDLGKARIVEKTPGTVPAHG